METLNRLNLTDLITASRAHAHTARRLAKAHRHSRVRSRPPHTQRLHALAARLITFFRFGVCCATRCGRTLLDFDAVPPRIDLE